MLYSKMFGKTKKEAKSDMVTTSHKLLYRGGFIRESVAGRYYFLPLGLKVRNKIIDIIRDEMNKAGSQEMLVPTLHPLDLWKESNRNKETGYELTTVKDRRGVEFALGGTAEEMFVDILRKVKVSYKDLPLNLYQFSTKFRDELRAKGGLLRVREFTMKDAYSFDVNETEFGKQYGNMMQTYTKIFNRLGIKTEVVPAAVGYIGGTQSHEFIMQSDVGESKYFISEDGLYIAHEDIAEFEREPVNQDEKIKKFEIINQPQWVKTMEDNIKHYKLPTNRFLKNVVYKNTSNKEIIIAVIRGDLDVNKAKLESSLKAIGQLAEADEIDLEKIGTQHGYVHSWGHTHRDGNKVRYIGDLSLTTVKNFIGGFKSDTQDSINVNYGRDFGCEFLADIAVAVEGHRAVGTGSKLIAKRGIEVGNLFNLEYHYSKKMADATFTDKDNTETAYYMGSYGVGIERTLAAIVESLSDEKGIIWPENVAPFKAHLIGIGLEDEKIIKNANKVYETLIEKGVDTLFDDRIDASAGEKMADADLIGCPYRLIVSPKTGDKIELKKRAEQKASLHTLSEIVNLLNA